MKNKVQLKGQLGAYIRWPIVLSGFLLMITIAVFYIDIFAGFIALGGLVVYILIALFLYTRVKPKIINDLIHFALEYEQVQNKMLYNMEIPYALLDENGKILWANRYFKKIVGDKGAYKGIDTIFSELAPEKFPDGDQNLVANAEYKEFYFRIVLSRINLEDVSKGNALVEAGAVYPNLYTLYLFDETEVKEYIKENQEQRLVCGLIYIDNYEEALTSTEEVRRSLLAALIDRKVSKYMQSFDAILNKLEKDKYLFVIQHRYLPQMQATKFSILDEVREINIGNEMPVTLSIGVGVNAATYNQSSEWAKNAIDLALGRGGDQAVLKDHDKIYYYGGKKKQVEKGTRVRARVKAHALKQLLEGKEQVVVMGHKIGDADSFGSAIGIYRAARTLNKKAYIVIDEVTKSVRPIKAWFENNSNYDSDMFLTKVQAMEIVDLNTALIIVDVNKPSYTECPELLSKTKTIVILDHHRQSSEGVENAVLSYIEPYASSACEMVAEILQYITDGVKLRQVEADAMYAGLMIDTNNFLSKTGVRTFEAAAFLKKSGADITKVRMIFREDMETYQARAEAVKKATLFDSCYIFAECDAEGIESPTVLGAQIANELLEIDGVKASFVFTNVAGVIYISARSLEEINVQLVMEKFGGGGHSTVAGAQLEGISVEAAMVQVKMQLKIMKNEGEI